MPRTKIRRQFEIAEAPGDMQSGTHFAFEAGQWKAKFETIKEVLDYERKKRKEVETNLNKLAYELGGVKNEVRQLEEKIKLLTGTPVQKPVEKKEEQSVEKPSSAKATKDKKEEPLAAEIPELKYQPTPAAEIPTEPFAGTTESPRLYIKFASEKEEFAAAPTEEPEPQPETEPEPEEQEVGDVMTALETSFKAETAETWGYATLLLSTLQNSPQELYHQRVNDQETREDAYYSFVDRIKKLNADYGNYKELVPIIDADIKNLDKVMPYIDYSLAELYREA